MINRAVDSCTKKDFIDTGWDKERVLMVLRSFGFFGIKEEYQEHVGQGITLAFSCPFPNCSYKHFVVHDSHTDWRFRCVECGREGTILDLIVACTKVPTEEVTEKVFDLLYI